MRSWLLGQVHTRELANDLTAETFAQALLSVHRFRGSTDTSAQAWLYAIARHLLSQYRRRHRTETAARRRLGMPISDYGGFDAAEELVDAQALAPHIHEALAALPPHEHEALSLRVIEQLPYEQVADRLEIAVPAARMRVHRALAALRLRLRGVNQ